LASLLGVSVAGKLAAVNHRVLYTYTMFIVVVGVDVVNAVVVPLPITVRQAWSVLWFLKPALHRYSA